MRRDQRDLDRRPRPLQLRGRLQRRSAADAAGARQQTAAGARPTGIRRWQRGGRWPARRRRRRRGQGSASWRIPRARSRNSICLARLAEGLGSANIDHRLRQRDFRDQGGDAAAPALGTAASPRSMQLDALLVVGSNLRAELPMLAHRVRKAALRGAAVSFINPAALRIPVPGRAATWSRRRSTMVAQLAARAARGARHAGATPPAALSPLLEGVQSERCAPRDRRLARAGSATRDLARRAGACVSRRYAELRAAGARAGARHRRDAWANSPRAATPRARISPACVPHRQAAGRSRASDTGAMRGRCSSNRCPATCCSAPNPGPMDCNRAGAGDARASAVRGRHHVVCIAGDAAGGARAAAGRHVRRNLGHLCESGRTLAELRRRRASRSGDARPAWKILRVLGNLLDLPNFDYQSSEQVRDELRARCRSRAEAGIRAAALRRRRQRRLNPCAMCRCTSIDPLLRRAASLAAKRAPAAAAPQEFAS